MKTLALIYASEGTGHKSAAFALREAFLAANPEGEAFCLDILDFVPPFMKNALRPDGAQRAVAMVALLLGL